MRRLGALVVSMLAAPWLALAALAEPTLTELDGAWTVQYIDQTLGRVAGEAHIDADAGTAEVRYHNPRSGESQVLRSTSLTLNGKILTIELEGRSPSDRRADGLHAPEIAYLLDAPAPEIVLRWGENTAAMAVKELPETDRNRVTLKLDVTDDLLSGSWDYRSHWFLGRARDGWGRDGAVEVDGEGVAWTMGLESWRRPRPIIYGAIAIDDQLALTMFSDGTSAANFPYPFSKNQGPVGKSRYLLVFGRELPRDYRRKLTIETVDSGINYVESGRQNDAADAVVGKRFTDGWRKLRERLPEGTNTEAAIKELDAIILRADLSPGAVPGINTFRLNGQEQGWLLQFGDNTAQLRIVRAIGRNNQRYEPTSYLFPGELVKIEIETAHALPVDSIPVIVGVDGRPLLLGDGEGMPAGRDPDNPRLYRTDYIRLSPGLAANGAVDLRTGNGLASVPVRQGSRLSAVLGRPGLISIPPSIAQATVFETTGDTAVGGDWARWLGAAAECAELVGAGVAIETSEAETISKLLLRSAESRFPIPGWMETKVSVGQHAAMLVLRDTFVRLLEHNRAQFTRLSSDQEILAFRRHMEPIIRQGATPLTKIEVDRLGGGHTEFIWSFEKDILTKLHDGKIDEVERWAIGATRQALERYRELMAAASQRARDIETCDVEGLLRLTGFGFEPVAAIAKTKMMEPVPGLGLWVPDFRARAWIDTVAIVGQQVDIQDKVAAEIRRDAVMSVGLATLSVVIIGGAIGSSAAIVATAVFDVFDLAFGAYEVIEPKWAEDAEVEFAKGAADVLGMQRLKRAEARQRSWSTVFVQLGYVAAPAVIGMGLDIPDLFKAFGEGFRLRKAARGRLAIMAMSNVEPLVAGGARAHEIERLVTNALEESRRAGPSAADAPAARQLAEAVGQANPQASPLRLRFDDVADAADNTVDDIGAYLDDIGASALRSAIDETTLEAALEAARRASIEDIALGFKTPAWASHFRPGTFDGIRRHLRRPDVMAMMEAAAERVARQLDGGDPRQARYAREVLESEPGLGIDAFERRVKELMKRKDDPVSPDYYRQASPGDAATTRSLRAAGWIAKSSEHTDKGLQLTIRDPYGRVGDVARSYDPATHTFVMHHVFRESDELAEKAVKGPISGWIEKGLRHPLIENKGTPTFQFFTMRIMNALNIPYGATSGIRHAKMSTILNARTIVQIDWFKRTYYPTTPWSEIPLDDLSRALMLTHSGRYGAETLAVAGYRVKSARFVEPLEGSMGGLKKYYIDEGGETFEAFLIRYGLDGNSRVSRSFDIDFEVEPW